MSSGTQSAPNAQAEGYARDESVRKVFSVLGIPPEELAYTMASYSRSRRSFLETNAFINSQKATQFLETFYFSYGHRSIADMAHVSMAIENISILCAIEVVAEQLWDGQERSTRYQDFSVTGYTVPDEVKEAGMAAHFSEAADHLFALYESVSRSAYEYYKAVLPMPEGMDEKQYERTLRARAFDVARYCLPLATNTSVGQITSARTLEGQISRLLGSAYGEVRRVGAALREANQSDAANPKEAKLRHLLQEAARLAGEGGLDLSRHFSEAMELLAPTPAAPTLVKYTAPDAYRAEVEKEFRKVYEGLLGRVPVEEAPPVTLVVVEDPLVEALAKLLYAVGRHPFRQIVHHVQRLSLPERQDLLAMAFEKRGPHDPWLHEFRTGYLNFDLLMDVGSLRDLHRHRRCQQLRQPLGTALGFEAPEVIDACGIGARYRTGLEGAFKAAERVNEACAPNGDYLLPLATRCRSLFSMDLAEVAYIAELRTRPTGHFSYRRIAHLMFEETVKRFPDFAPYIRAVSPDYEDLLER